MNCMKRAYLTGIQRMVLGVILCISILYLGKFHRQLELKRYLQFGQSYKPGSGVKNTTSDQAFQTVNSSENFSDEHQLKRSNTDDGTKCYPHTKLYYLKIHKTGSDTFTNILKRFTQRKSLKTPSFSRFQPFPDPNITSYLVPVRYLYSKMQSARLADMDEVQMSMFRAKALEENKGSDVIDYHTIFNESAVQEILGTDVVNIVSLRHPLSHMISFTSYFKMWENEGFETADHILEYLTNSTVHTDKKIFGTGLHRYQVSITRNFMAYSLGYYLAKYNTVDEFLSYINQTFSLAIILEKYSQSLLLVKRKLCWELKDVLYIKLNSQQRNEYRRTLETSQTNFQHYESLHRNLSNVDYALYDLFTKRNNEEARSYGADFEEELVEFEDINGKVNTFCWNIFEEVQSAEGVPKYMLLGKTFEVKSTKYNDGFTVNGTECLFMILKTNFYASYLQIKQYPELCDLKDVPNFLIAQEVFTKSDPFCVSRGLNVTSILLNPNFWLLRDPFE